MTPDPEDPSPEEERCARITFAFMFERDEAKAAKLLKQSSEAFITSIRARTRRKLDAMQVTLDAAEELLDRAAKLPARSAERRRLIALANVYTGSARRARLELEGVRSS
jgi:endo-alpha-1,4-polygalactosaminidase (GH114 family)